jgi:2-amino-4-hydroxy-6-hydroxymethyldihydropteridine diphosphokinase
MPESKSLILGLGSNIGNRQSNLNQALYFIQDKIGDIDQKSSVFESEAWPLANQNPYLNMVIHVSTHLFPLIILKEIQQIENEIGRVRNTKWESRIIDIDILFFNNYHFKTPNLIIPHPFIQNRKFVLEPLVEILPNKKHPKLKLSCLDLLNKCEDTSWLKIFDLN